MYIYIFLFFTQQQNLLLLQIEWNKIGNIYNNKQIFIVTSLIFGGSL